VSRYDFFRRRIAPVLFLCVVGLIVFDTCNKQERTHATFVLDFGDAEKSVRAVEAELTVGGDVIGMFHRQALPGGTIGPCKFETALPETVGELRIDVDLGGKHRTVLRRVVADEGSKVTVLLGADLR
jgi:hypothetical protein